ncbi:hypothetical protein OH76DRAFT_1413395 [Lentinus brumalis]|uniref:Uncharacterized protein n=1 Tax=Lentinus brumalis TaxID=2498619 RepID=A0A371CHF9_9APHY|nr:hypothetical protein OH76DRAFT_1413395 [Polyporus brumalis]
MLELQLRYVGLPEVPAVHSVMRATGILNPVSGWPASAVSPGRSAIVPYVRDLPRQLGNEFLIVFQSVTVQELALECRVHLEARFIRVHTAALCI